MAMKFQLCPTYAQALKILRKQEKKKHRKSIDQYRSEDTSTDCSSFFPQLINVNTENLFYHKPLPKYTVQLSHYFSSEVRVNRVRMIHSNRFSTLKAWMVVLLIAALNELTPDQIFELQRE